MVECPLVCQGRVILRTKASCTWPKLRAEHREIATAVPNAGVIADTDGTLYGTTSDLCENCAAFGSVFRLTR